MSRGRPTRARARRGTARRIAVRGGAALWVLFTVVAVGAGLAAANSVGSAISDAGSQPRSDAQIRAALGAAARSPGTGASPTATASSGGSGPHHHNTQRPHSSTAPGAGTPGGSGATVSPSGAQHSPSPKPTPSPGGGQPGGSGGPTGGTGGGQGGTEQRATLSSYAGTVVASCTNDNVTLLTWSPALGYRVNEVRRGPSREAEITFAGDSHADVTMVVTCGTDGRPRATIETDSGSGDY